MPEIILPNGQSAFQQFSNAPKPSDYWDIDREKMDAMVRETGPEAAAAVLYVKDGQGSDDYFYARIDWQGCVDFYQHDPDQPDDPDYTHICDLEDYVNRLDTLLTLSKAYFERARGSWPG